MPFKFKPYYLFVPLALLLILMSFIPYKHSMNLAIKGAAYSLNFADSLKSFAMLFLLLWILYLFTTRILFSKILTWIHTLTTIGVVFIIIVLFYYFSGSQNPASAGELSFQTGPNLPMLVPFLIWFLLIMQLSYVLNLLLGVIRRLN